MVRHTDEADDEASDITEYDVDPDDPAPYDQITKGDAVDVVYVPNRGKAPSKTKSGVVTYVNRRDDGSVRSVNVDTEDEYDDGTPKTFEFDEYGRITSHGRVRETTIGDVTRVVVRTYDDVDTDDRDVTIPSEGAEYVDTVRGKTFVVASVEDDDRVESRLITWEDGTASTEEEFVDDRRTERLVPADDAVDVPIADGGTSVDDFEAAKSDVADAVRATDDRTAWEAFGRETQRRVSDVEVGRYAAVAYTLSVEAYAADMDLSRCVVPAVVWGVTDKAYAYDRLGDVFDAVAVFHTGAAGPYVDGIRKKVADAIDPEVVVTEPIADPETVDDREPVTDGGTDVCDRCDDPSDDVRDVDVGRREHTRVVDRGHTDRDTGERVGRDVRTQTEHFGFALCPSCRDETDQTEPPEHEAGAYTVTYRRDGVVETADFAGSAIVEHFETIDAIEVVDVTHHDETDQPEPVTDGGRDVEAVTVYVIDGAHETTSAAKAERARSNGAHVTAKSRLR